MVLIKGAGDELYLLYNNKIEMTSTLTNVSSFSPHRVYKTDS